MAVPRRTVSEWVTVARISRGVGHLFFEGASDARIIEQAFGYPKNVDFREAAEIDCDMTGFDSLHGGNKYRLLVLADASALGRCDSIKCFVDSDFSIFVSFLVDTDNIFGTLSSANLPAMTLTFEWLQGVLKKAYGFTVDSAVWSFLRNTLCFAFVARYISATSEKPHPAASVSDFVSYKSGSFSFDSARYICRYFGVDKTKSLVIQDSIKMYSEVMDFDIKMTCNSNDLFDLIYIILRKSGKISGSANREVVRQTYMGAFDERVFISIEFKPLRDWLGSFVKL